MNRHLALAALLFASLARPAFAEGSQEFMLHNDVGSAVTHVYATTVDVDDWGADLLGDQTLVSGKAAKVTFANFPDDACRFDLRVVLEGGQAWQIKGLDLCGVNDLILEKRAGQVVYRRQ